MTRSTNAYRAGVALAAFTSLMIVWTSIVRDDGHAAGGFMVILAGPVGAFATWFRADGLARTMFGLAVMQAFLGILTATAPVVANSPGGSANALVFNGAFVLLWLGSAALFRWAASPLERSGSVMPR